MSEIDRAIALLRKLGELHRPRLRPAVDAEVPGFYDVQCPACHGSVWHRWKEGDPPVQCEYWTEYQSFWVVKS